MQHHTSADVSAPVLYAVTKTPARMRLQAPAALSRRAHSAALVAADASSPQWL
jgi:hypothetical protein